ncbi:hypothetical protein N8751_00830 [bacterium]|nr:hypothetical protein [bacterium]
MTTKENKYFIFDDLQKGNVLDISLAFIDNSVELEKFSKFLSIELINYSNDKLYSDNDNIQSLYKIKSNNYLHFKIDLINDKGLSINAVNIDGIVPTVLLVDNKTMFFYRLSSIVEDIIVQGDDTMDTIREEEEEDLSEELEFYGKYFDFKGEEDFSIVREPLDILMGLDDRTPINDEDGDFLFTKEEVITDMVMNDIDIDAEQLGSGYSVIVDHAINGQAQIMGYDDYQPPIFKGELTEQSGSGYYPDLGKDNVGGQMVISSYDDNNPPVFQQGGVDLKVLDKKILHITNYIIKKGDYKLPQYVLNDL